MKPPPPHAFVNKLIALTLGLLVFAGTLGLGAVWARQEIFHTADRNRAVEIRIAEVERRLDEVDAEVAAALNPDALIRQNDAMKLGLVMPSEEQVTRVAGEAEFRLASKRHREIFTVATAAASPVSQSLSFRIEQAAIR